MKYLAPLDETDPDASYHDGDEATSTLGSIPPGAAFEATQREIVHVITESGQTPSAANLTQLYQAIVAMIAAATASSGDDVGEYHLRAVNSIPSNEILADGALLSRTVFPELFAKIGTTFGAGDGSTTFAAPDMRGVFIRGLDLGRGLDSGRALGVLQSSQNLAHTHQVGSTDSESYATPYSSQEMIHDYIGSLGPVVTTSSSGGSEARPVNMAAVITIQFE